MRGKERWRRCEERCEVFRRNVIESIWVYYTLLLLWILGDIIMGDRYPVLFPINTLALVLFLPATFAIVAPIVTRRRKLRLCAGVSVVLVALQWRLFWRRLIGCPITGGRNLHSEGVIVRPYKNPAGRGSALRIPSTPG